MNLYSPVISGSLTVTGSTSFIGNVTMTGTVSATASNAELLSGTGSVGFTTTGSFTTMSGSVSSRVSQIETVYATTGSNSFRATQSITGSLTVTGQITAQTLNVQQVTSSIIYSSGSNVFGCDINSRQTFTGSFYQSGSNMNINAGCVIIGNTASPASDFYFNVTTVCAGTNATVAQFYNAEYTSGTRGFIRIRNSANIGATTSAYIGQGQDSKTYIYNNDPSRAGDIVISASGLVGMNTCAPIAQLHVRTSVLSANRPTDLATSATNSAVYFTTINGSSAGIAFGQTGANTNYIQATYENGSSSTPLSLNPYGGNVGIGTNLPDAKLHICNATAGGTNNYLIIVQNCCTVADSRAGIAFSNNSQTPSAGGLSGASIQTSNNGIDGAGNLLFSTLISGAGCERMRIASSGNVGIGCSAPNYILDVRDTKASGASGIRLTTQSTSAGPILVLNYSPGTLTNWGIGTSQQISHALEFASSAVGGDPATAGTTRLLITCNGNVGINNVNTRAALEINQACSDQNNGGFMFRTLDLPDNTWTTFFTPPANWGGITTLTWVGTNDHNRSGAAQIRWSYQNCSAALGPTTTIFNDSQNAPGYFRYSGGNLQICVDGAGAGKRLQVLIQGSRGA